MNKELKQGNMKSLLIRVLCGESTIVFDEVRFYDFSNMEDFRSYNSLCEDLVKKYPNSHLIVFKV